MNAYGVILKTQALLVFQYRAQAIAGVFTQCMFGIMRVFAMIAFYEGTSPGAQPLTLNQAVSYIWLTQMLLTAIAFGPDPLMVAMVREGGIAYEMVRPIRLSLAWLMRSMAFRGVLPLMRGIPMLVIALMLPKPYGIDLSHLFTGGFLRGLASVGICLLALLFAWLLASVLNNFTNILTVYLMSDDGLVRFVPLVMWFFGGIVVPMPFFPEAAMAYLKYTPFLGLMDTPTRLLMGNLQGPDILFALCVQLFWILAFLIIDDLLLESRLKRALVQGG